MTKELLEQLKGYVDLAKKIMPEIAEIYKLLYEELQKQGFSKEDAIKIVVNYKPGGPN